MSEPWEDFADESTPVAVEEPESDSTAFDTQPPWVDFQPPEQQARRRGLVQQMEEAQPGIVDRVALGAVEGIGTGAEGLREAIINVPNLPALAGQIVAPKLFPPGMEMPFEWGKVPFTLREQQEIAPQSGEVEATAAGLGAIGEGLIGQGRAALRPAEALVGRKVPIRPPVPAEEERARGLEAASSVVGAKYAAYDLLRFFATPEGLTTFAAAPYQLARSLLAAGFATEMAGSVAEAARQAGEMEATATTPEEKAQAKRAKFSLFANVIFPGLIAGGAWRAGGGAVPPSRPPPRQPPRLPPGAEVVRGPIEPPPAGPREIDFPKARAEQLRQAEAEAELAEARESIAKQIEDGKLDPLSKNSLGIIAQSLADSMGARLRRSKPKPPGGPSAIQRQAEAPVPGVPTQPVQDVGAVPRPTISPPVRPGGGGEARPSGNAPSPPQPQPPGGPRAPIAPAAPSLTGDHFTIARLALKRLGVSTGDVNALLRGATDVAEVVPEKGRVEATAILEAFDDAERRIMEGGEQPPPPSPPEAPPPAPAPAPVQPKPKLPPAPEGALEEVDAGEFGQRFFAIRKGTYKSTDGGTYTPGTGVSEAQVRMLGFEPPPPPPKGTTLRTISEAEAEFRPKLTPEERAALEKKAASEIAANAEAARKKADEAMASLQAERNATAPSASEAPPAPAGPEPMFLQVPASQWTLPTLRKYLGQGQRQAIANALNSRLGLKGLQKITGATPESVILKRIKEALEKKPERAPTVEAAPEPAAPPTEPAAPETLRSAVDAFTESDADGLSNIFPAFRTKEGSQITISETHEPRIKTNDPSYFDDAGFWFPVDKAEVKSIIYSDDPSGAINGNTEAMVESSAHGKTGLFISIRELDKAGGDYKKALQSKLEETLAKPVAEAPATPISPAAPPGVESKPAERGTLSKPTKIPEEVAYDTALNEFRAASKEFGKTQKAYRAREIGDDEFLAARAKFDAASAKSDAAETAFIEAKNRAEPMKKAGTPAVSPEALTPTVQPKPAAPAAVVQAKRPAAPPSDQTKPTGPLKGAQQKKYLIAEAQKALSEAPDEVVRKSSDADNDMARVSASESGARAKITEAGQSSEDIMVGELADLLEKYRVPTMWLGSKGVKSLEPGEWAYEPHEAKSMSAGSRINELRSAIRRAQWEQGETITIEVPGDGTFVITNTKKAIKDFLQRAKKFPTTVAKVQEPSQARVTPSKPAPVETRRTVESDAEAVRSFASTDETRFVLQYVMSDGKHLIATDGRRMIIVDRKGPGTEANPKFYDQEGNLQDAPVSPEKLAESKAEWEEARKKNKKIGAFEPPKFPTWTQVVPEKTVSWFKNLDTERLFRLAKQAQGVLTETSRVITLYRDAEGRLGISAGTPDVGDYAADITPTSKPLISHNGDYFLEMADTARKLGLKQIEIRGSTTDTSLSPMTMEGPGVKMVLMPIRMSGEGPEFADAVKAARGAGADIPESAAGGVEPPAEEPPTFTGPGAQGITEIQERAARSAAAGVPPPGNNPTAVIPGDPSIEVGRQPKDFNLFNRANSPQWTFWFGKLGEAAKKAWETISLAEYRIRENVGRDIERYVAGVSRSLPRQWHRKGGEALFNVLDGRKLEDIEAEWSGKPDGAKVIAATREVKTRLEEIRTTIRDTKRENTSAALASLKKDTLTDLYRENVDRNVTEATAPTKQEMADAISLVEFPDDWGIADGSYLPHMFFGDWRITAQRPGEPNPGFVTRAKSVSEATARIREFAKSNPDYQGAQWKVAQDSVVPSDMIRLGDRRFWKLVSDMKENAADSFDVRGALKGVIGRKAAKTKWFGNLQKRLGFGGYSRNFDQVMSAYLGGFHRWRELSAANREVMPLIEQTRREGRLSAATELESLFDYVWGKPAQSTVQFDNFVRQIPGVRDFVKPMALERWSRNARKLVAMGTLKTIRFSLVNRLQPLQGLYPLIGEKTLAWAKLAQHSAEGKALLDEAGVRFDPGQWGVEGAGFSRLREWGQRFSGEQSNQEIAFLGMYRHGRNQGLSHAEAVNYGKLRGQLMTQFTPLKADIPPAMRGPLTSAFFQFKRFPIKQAELLTKMAADRNVPGVARWLVTMAVTGGASYFLRQFLIPADKRKELRDLLVKEVGEDGADYIFYGLPNLIGADISGSLTLGDEPFGQSLYEKVGRQIVGPGVSIAYETGKAAMTPRRAALTPAQEIETTLRRYPSLRPLAELIALVRSDVDLRSPDGEVRYRRSVSDAIRGLGSLRSTKESKVKLYTDWIVEVAKEIQDLKNGYYLATTKPDGDVEAAREKIVRFNTRWPEFSIRGAEMHEYLKLRGKESNRTDLERLAGRRFRSVLSETEQSEE